MTAEQPGAKPTSVETIGRALAQLTMDYREALAAAGGQADLVLLTLPAEWVTLAARLHELLVVDAVRQGMAVEAFRQPAERIATCEHCGGALFVITWDDSSDTGRTVCSRCGGELSV